MSSEKRFTPSVSLKKSEKEFLEQKAAKAELNYTSYMREVALENISQDPEQFSKYDLAGEIKQLRKAVLSMGNNLNQIARVANTTGTVNPGRIEDIRNMLFGITQQLKQMDQ